MEVGASPAILSIEAAEKLVKKQLAYGFEYSGLAFFGNKLYASCNLGLLEIENASPTKLYQWTKSDSVVEGPWLDRANGLLWVWLIGTDQVANYDGKSWKTMRMPEPRAGFSRGNILEGFRGIGNSRTFWLEGAWHAWAWNPKHSNWNDERIPPALRAGLRSDPILRRLVPTDDALQFVMLRDVELSHSDSQVPRKQKGDAIYYSDDSWHEVTNKSHFVFFAEQTVSTGKTGYVRSSRGDVLEVTTNGIVKLDCPGKCEALAVTSSNSLAASFHNLGVYAFNSQWELLFKAPYPSTEDKYWAHLAESAGEIALSLAPRGHLVGDKRVYDSTASIWVFNRQRLEQVPFAKAPQSK